MALLASLVGVVAVGLAALRSGLAGEVRPVWSADLAPRLWMFVPPLLYGGLAVLPRGWARAAAVLLVLGTHLADAFTYLTAGGSRCIRAGTSGVRVLARI